MKVKKDKPKKEKLKKGVTTSPAIRKTKKQKKIKKIQNDSPVAKTVKQELTECGENSGKRILLRQQIWNQYLKTFYEIEKLDQKQKQIMQFCTSKSLTPPKRKGRFLNFIRNCFVNQAEITDDQVNELFDLLLKKYDDFKSGTYCHVENKDSIPETKPTPKLSKNKRKKLSRAASNDKDTNLTTVESMEQTVDESKWEKTKVKNRKRVKISKESDRINQHT